MEKELFLSTDMVDSKLRDDFWRDAVKPVFELSENSDDHLKGFSGTLRSRMMGSLLVGSTSFNEQKYERTRRLIIHSGFDHYVLQIILAGTLRGNFNGIDVFAEPGDIVILDLSQVVSSAVEKGARITIIIPRHELEKLAGWRNLHGAVLKSQAPTTGLLFNYVKGMVDISAQLNATEAIAAKEAMLLLLASSLNGTEQDLTNNVAINLTMRHRILAYIDDNLTDYMLGPHSLQQHFHVSRSHLYRAFEQDGGVAKVIRDKRLELAYRLLVETQGKQLSLKEIAYRCGFPDASQFTKAFKSLYGVTPKNARQSNTLISPDGSSISMLQNYLASQADKVKANHPDGPVKPPNRI